MAAAASVECTETRGVVLRVKRKRTEDPVEALVVSHVVPTKKVHLSSEEPKLVSKSTEQNQPKENVKVDQVFRFLGTCCEEDDSKSKDLLKNIKTKPISHGNLKKSIRPNIADQLQKKQREAKKESHSDARFKILSSNRQDNEAASSTKDVNSNEDLEQSELKRTISSDGSTDSADDEVRRLFKVYDVIRDEESEKSSESTSTPKTNKPEDSNVILCNSVKMMREKLVVSDEIQPANIAERGYVYDYYFASNTQSELGDILEITGVNDDFCLETIDKEFDEMFDDDDDSNDENNWRNDYPDEGLWSSDEDSKTSRRRQVHEDFGFDMDDERTKYHQQAFGEDLSSDDELDCYGEPYTLSSRSEAYQEQLSDEFESEGF